MTTQVIEAVFENGLLKPLTPLENVLTEGQHIKIQFEIVNAPTTAQTDLKPEEILKEALSRVRVYNSVEEFRNSPEYNYMGGAIVGLGKGSILYMAEDFDATPEEFEEYL